VEVMEMVEVTKPIIPIEVTVKEAVEATKSIVPIKVTVVETVKAKCGASRWSASHRHLRHRTGHESAPHSHPGH
jgi:hypothetical protein